MFKIFVKFEGVNNSMEKEIGIREKSKFNILQ